MSSGVPVTTTSSGNLAVGPEVMLLSLLVTVPNRFSANIIIVSLFVTRRAPIGIFLISSKVCIRNYRRVRGRGSYLVHQVREEDHHGVDDSHVGAYCTVRAGGLRVVFVGDVTEQEISSFHKSDKFSFYLPYEISS